VRKSSQGRSDNGETSLGFANLRPSGAKATGGPSKPSLDGSPLDALGGEGTPVDVDPQSGAGDADGGAVDRKFTDAAVEFLGSDEFVPLDVGQGSHNVDPGRRPDVALAVRAELGRSVGSRGDPYIAHVSEMTENGVPIRTVTLSTGFTSTDSIARDSQRRLSAPDHFNITDNIPRRFRPRLGRHLRFVRLR